ncbi:hypothetical protein E6C27_scaffold45606G00010 [Cucumis melo var. makuwa]|uniref:Uncharacterized protein n=1 Tax=Cucumis melo var. makuwa TaxID=1194695 RepID=A0A5A7TGU1_CUCMM|nr:hypothetical protein E6C27_scaffold45606G00010 [Cucumis melo var. makuwa]
MSTHHILGLKKVPRVRLFADESELRGANPSTRGLGWANLWCTGCYANSSAGQLSWYGRTAAPREILLYTSSRTRFLNITSIGERCKHREVFSDLVLNERTCTFPITKMKESQPIPAIAIYEPVAFLISLDAPFLSWNSLPEQQN